MPTLFGIIQRQLFTNSGGRTGNEHRGHCPSLRLIARITCPSTGNCS
ncbi:Uncharacterised protein [Vibrio cholerae]|nr:Uncharacterised protein [Vibrio cholerae]CSI86404.1 Uncharacterised protein [Vibrio cholerae]